MSMNTPEEFERLRKENDILRGLLPALNAPCVYCGLTNMAQCVHGFPGCPQADDLMCGEESSMRSVIERLHVLEGRQKLHQPDASVTVDGVTLMLPASARLYLRISDKVHVEWYQKGESTVYGVRVYAGGALVAQVPPRFDSISGAQTWAEKFVNAVRD